MRRSALCSLLMLAASMANASSVPNEADYPARYSVVNTIKMGSFMVGKFCTMTLRDEAAPTIILVVQRKGHGGCHVWDAGSILHGRRDKSSIRLLATDDKGELKAEDWPVTNTAVVGLSASPQ